MLSNKSLVQRQNSLKAELIRKYNINFMNIIILMNLQTFLEIQFFNEGHHGTYFTIKNRYYSLLTKMVFIRYICYYYT